jgi:hypothetical protein
MPSILRIGFDFDGVILYNPFRITRPIVYNLKKYLFKKRVDKFFVPSVGWKQQLVRFIHNSSYKPNDGFDQFIALTKNQQVQIYIITGRFSFLQKDLTKLIRRYHLENIPLYQNLKDEQPTIFKARKIRELKLDYFVEDNWDVVKYLNQKTTTKVIWIRNLIDRWFISHQPQVDNLGEALQQIQNSKIQITNQ